MPRTEALVYDFVTEMTTTKKVADETTHGQESINDQQMST